MTRLRTAAYYAGVLFSASAGQICIALLHSFIAQGWPSKSDGSRMHWKNNNTGARQRDCIGQTGKNPCNDKTVTKHEQHGQRRVNKRTKG